MKDESIAVGAVVEALLWVRLVFYVWPRLQENLYDLTRLARNGYGIWELFGVFPDPGIKGLALRVLVQRGGSVTILVGVELCGVKRA